MWLRRGAISASVILALVGCDERKSATSATNPSSYAQSSAPVSVKGFKERMDELIENLNRSQNQAASDLADRIRSVKVNDVAGAEYSICALLYRAAYDTQGHRNSRGGEDSFTDVQRESLKKEALEWLTQSVRDGDRSAQEAMADLLIISGKADPAFVHGSDFSGLATLCTCDFDEALRLYQKAATKDFYGSAQYKLGCMYFFGQTADLGGQGPKQDRAQGVRWWIKAAQHNDEAKRTIDNLPYKYNVTVESLLKPAEAIEWYKKVLGVGVAPRMEQDSFGKEMVRVPLTSTGWVGGDEILRKMLEIAARADPEIEVPAEANEHFGRGRLALQEGQKLARDGNRATAAARLADAILEFDDAVTVAPWWCGGYLGRAWAEEELAGIASAKKRDLYKCARDDYQHGAWGSPPGKVRDQEIQWQGGVEQKLRYLEEDKNLEEEVAAFPHAKSGDAAKSDVIGHWSAHERDGQICLLYVFPDLSCEYVTVPDEGDALGDLIMSKSTKGRMKFINRTYVMEDSSHRRVVEFVVDRDQLRRVSDRKLFGYIKPDPIWKDDSALNGEYIEFDADGNTTGKVIEIRGGGFARKWATIGEGISQTITDRSNKGFVVASSDHYYFNPDYPTSFFTKKYEYVQK